MALACVVLKSCNSASRLPGGLGQTMSALWASVSPSVNLEAKWVIPDASPSSKSLTVLHMVEIDSQTNL